MNKYLIGAVGILIVFAAGTWVGHKVSKPQIVSTVDSLSTFQKDSISAYWKSQVKTVTKTIRITTTGTAKHDTLWQTDSTESDGWMQIALELQKQLDAVQNVTQTAPGAPQKTSKNINVGITAGLNYGLITGKFSPVLTIPVRYRHVLFVPIVEYRMEVIAGAGVGLTF